jgi:hypothetical protein
VNPWKKQKCARLSSPQILGQVDPNTTRKSSQSASHEFVDRKFPFQLARVRVGCSRAWTIEPNQQRRRYPTLCLLPVATQKLERFAIEQLERHAKNEAMSIIGIA